MFRPRRAPRPRPVLALVAASALFAGSLGAAASASAAPGDRTSIALTGASSDFGAIKTGTTITRTLTLLNDGLDAVTVDPAPLTALAAPFALVSTTIVAGSPIPANSTRTLTVTYTAPTAGTVSNQPVALAALNVDGMDSATLAITFSGRSLATDRSHFDLTGPAASTSIDFGTVEVGSSSTRRLTLTVGGIDDLRFAAADVDVRSTGGAPVPAITIAGSSVGSGLTLKPGATATVDLLFAPTAAATLSGTITVTGRVMNGDPEAPSVVRQLPFTAVARVVPVPTPTPTVDPVPADPTPTPGSGSGAGEGTATGAAAGPGAAAGHSAPAPAPTTGASADRRLASTGTDPLPAATLGALLLLAGALLTLTLRNTLTRRP